MIGINGTPIGYYTDPVTDKLVRNTRLTIYGYTNTLAEFYAEEHDFNFVSLGTYDKPRTIGLAGGCIWRFDETSGTLSVYNGSNTGDYSRSSPAPWYHLKEKITKISIDEKVKTIGLYAFFDLAKVTEVSVPLQVRSSRYILISRLNRSGDRQSYHSIRTVALAQ